MHTILAALFLLTQPHNDTITATHKLRFVPIQMALQIAGVRGISAAPEQIATRPWNGPFTTNLKADLDSLPDGITTLVMDSVENSVTVTGTVDAVRKFKEVLDLLDVPSRRVRMAISVHRLKPGDLEALGVRPSDVQQINTRVRILSGVEPASKIAARLPALASGESTVMNNQPSQVHWSNPDRTSAGVVQVRPRVNGDLSVSINADVATADKTHDQIERRAFSGARRIKGNEPMVMLLRDSVAVIIAIKQVQEPNP